MFNIIEKYSCYLLAEVFISMLNATLSLFNAQHEVLLDEGLSFFILSGDEGSTFYQSSEQVGLVSFYNIS